MKRRLSLALILSIVALVGTFAMTAAASEEVYDPRTLEIGRKLACPICEGQSVADSQSALAQEMMSTIESQVQAGKSEEEIINFFVARFGDEVLLEPPREGFTLTLWWIPVAVLLLGAAAVILYLRDGIALGRSKVSDERERDPELEAIAREVLDEPSSGSSLATGRGPK